MHDWPAGPEFLADKKVLGSVGLQWLVRWCREGWRVREGEPAAAAG